MPKLTKTYIDKVQLPASGYEIHWDDKVGGYGLRVTASGVRAFVAQGRVNGKAVIITIGRYGLYTEAQAREKAQSLLQQMREGIDPRAVKKQAEAESVTLKEVFDSYLSRPGKLKESTKDWYRFFIEKTFKDWADMPVVNITRDMVKTRHAELVKNGLKGKKRKGGAPGSANSAMVVLRIIMNYAADEHTLPDGTPLIPHNPVAAMKRHWAPAGDRSMRYIEFDRVGLVWNALHDARLTARNRDALAGVNFVMFLMTTGCRRSEAARLRWSDVHIDKDDPAKSYWFLGDRKQGKPIMLPLSTATTKVLEACEKADGNDHVFPSRGKAGHITDPRAVLDEVDKVAGRIVGAHGLRKTLSNISQRECRIEKFRTDLLLGHKPAQEDVTSRAYLDLTDLRWLHPEIEQIGAWIEEKGLVAAGKNVVVLADRA
ncbi:integrase family protein [Maritimibacter sp. DP1N21-5]|uniref:tyrosine-type recombinase/integrase n=1 Tax=Maritimibacter sp. DP1N21-5 TaxID=2836867 RepID=UPI001C47A51A|nr:integrase family protein [Maritimibacter sp. DP1N21-5]MBV7409622.1 integrase family protein [Maritimibacter sp. DP1N21-5]